MEFIFYVATFILISFLSGIALRQICASLGRSLSPSASGTIRAIVALVSVEAIFHRDQYTEYLADFGLAGYLAPIGATGVAFVTYLLLRKVSAPPPTEADQLDSPASADASSTERKALGFAVLALWGMISFAILFVFNG
jgi:hypothetical protein